jgi:flagellar biosynthesis protein FlhG
LGHVIQGVQPIQSIIVKGPEDIHILPASSGIQELTEMSERKRDRLVNELSSILGAYDFLLIDTAAGISNNVVRFLEVARRVIVVLSPEPTAIVDAYALIKVLLKRDAHKQIQLLVNQAGEKEEASQVHRQLSNVAERFLGKGLGFLGSIPQDDKVAECVRIQQPLMVCHPRIPVSRSFQKIARSLMAQPQVGNRLSSLWKEEK